MIETTKFRILKLWSTFSKKDIVIIAKQTKEEGERRERERRKKRRAGRKVR